MNPTSKSHLLASIFFLVFTAGLIFSGVLQPVAHSTVERTAASVPELLNGNNTRPPNPSPAAGEAEPKYLREDKAQSQQPALVESSRQPTHAQGVLYNHHTLPNRSQSQAMYGGTFTRANTFSINPTQQSLQGAFPQTDEREQLLVPKASFIYAPASPNVGQAVQFTSTSRGPILFLKWDFNDDGITDSISPTPTHIFNGAGPYKISLEAANPFGQSATSQFIFIGSTGNRPQVTSLSRTYESYYLKGTPFDNSFNARVNWRGLPGTAMFTINNGSPIFTQGSANGASQTFNLQSDFTPSFSPSMMRITPTNAAAVVGDTVLERVYVFPYPRWLDEELFTDSNVIKFSTSGGAIIAKINFEFPKPHLSGNVNIPSWVPFVGGRFGLTETFAYIKGEVSSKGNGKISVGGQTGFEGMGLTLKGSVSGDGTFLINRKGLSLTSAALKLQIDGSLKKEAGILQVIPGLAALNFIPVVKRFNQSARVIGELNASLNFAANWAQDQNQRLKFKDGTGGLSLGLKATLAVNISKHIKAKGWVAGSGSVKVGVPDSPFVRELRIFFEAGAEVKGDGIFKFVNFTKRVGYGCKWTPAAGTSCSSNPFAPGLNPQEAELKAPSVALIQPDYERFGPYSVFRQPASDAQQSTVAVESETPQAAPQAAIVSNIFLEAKPFFMNVGNNGRMLLWVQQNPALPVLQSTNISYVFDDGSGWSAPALIASDTRAEFQLVAAQDANGNVVAVWARVKNPNFTTPINTAEDLPLYYKELEVVSSTFNPITRTWSAVTPVTNDTALDTNLELSTDGAGGLLLTWLANANGEFTSSASSPSVLKYARWTGLNWSVPISISVQAGVSDFVLAVRDDGLLVMPRDPNLEMPDDGVLDLYIWHNNDWISVGTFASGGGDNRLPSVAYDANNKGHILWVRGDNLVHATLSNPMPVVVRGGSSSMSFYGAKLLNNAQGMLTLLWHAAADNGAANIFATIYDPTSQTWSADRQLTKDEWLAHDVSGYYGSDGKLKLAYLSTEILRTTRTVVLDGENVIIENIPEDGRTDLCVFEHSLGVDLAVKDKDLSLNTPAPQAGDLVMATLTLSNAGDFAVNNFNINLYAGEPNFGGVLLESRRVTTPLVGAAQVTQTFSFNYSQSGGNIVAVIDAGNEVAEIAENNNRANVFLENTPPNVIVWADVTSGHSPLTVNFSANASYDEDGDTLDFIWSFSDGSLSQTGPLVSHTFNQIGLYSVTVTATDSRGAVGMAEVLINVGCSTLTFTPQALPGGRLSTFYNQTVSANGGSAPYSFAVTSGSLPPGLTLSTSGVLTGFPTLTGTYVFTISATYANGCPGSQDYTMVITQDNANNLFDFDGDGKTDVAVFRPSSSYWYIKNSSNNSLRSEQFGTVGDRIVPEDFDGDGRANMAVFRPSTGYWYTSSDPATNYGAVPFGTSGDIPLPGDYEGDGKTDICVFRPSNGTYYLLRSSDGALRAQQWGVNGDVPLRGDYDGDGKTDFAVFRPSTSAFYILRSTAGIAGYQFGSAGDKPVVGDFDGDGKADVAVFRPSTGAWYIERSTLGFFAATFGTNGDVPVTGDYDGDRKWDIAVFRPSTGTFYILQSTGGFRGEQFGISTDIPVPSAYTP